MKLDRKHVNKQATRRPLKENELKQNYKNEKFVFQNVKNELLFMISISKSLKVNTTISSAKSLAAMWVLI